MPGIPDSVERFIYEYIDSVNMLETLLFMHSNAAKEWTAQSLTAELRGNLNSLEQCLLQLKAARLIREASAPDSCIYHPEDAAMSDTILALSDAYKIQRHKIFELIFSPMKKARDFADAFTRASAKDKKEDENG